MSAVGAEHAAVARLRAQENTAAFAVEEVHARVRGHAFHRRMSALGACQERGCFDRSGHSGVTVDSVVVPGAGLESVARQAIS